jgi:drug/metabolite transporter (DMT)-like permease
MRKLQNTLKSLSQNTSLLILVLLAVDGLHFIYARALREYMHPVASVTWVLGIGALEVGIFAAQRGMFRWETFRKHAGFFLAIGALVGVSTALNYTAVKYIEPGVASLLSQMSILFGVALGVFGLRERLSGRQRLGAGIALAGVLVITFQPGDFLRLGALMVIGAAFMYALHAAVVKRYGGGIDFLEFFVWRLVATTGVLIVLAGALGEWALPPNAAAWGLVLIAGTMDVAVSRTLYYIALRRLSVSIHALIFTLSPVVAILWAWGLFGTIPTGRELLGGGVVLVGVAVVTYRRAGNRLR